MIASFSIKIRNDLIASYSIKILWGVPNKNEGKGAWLGYGGIHASKNPEI